MSIDFINTGFISNVNVLNHKIAIIDENGFEKSYADMARDIDVNSNKMPSGRPLVFLKIGNDYDGVIDYLTCLKLRIPFLILDRGLEDTLLSGLVDKYHPNYLIDKGEVIELSKFEHTVHDDLAILLSTSGSTGTPKLVRLSHRNINSNTKSIVEYLGLTNTDVAITSMPMSYSYGLSILNTHLLANATVILNDDPVISRSFWDKVNNYNVTSISGVPFTFQMLKRIKFDTYELPSLRYLTQAGGKLDKPTLDYLYSCTSNKKQQLFIMYGQTEASPRISYIEYDNTVKNGCIGTSVPGGKLEVRDVNSGKTLAANCEGEIVYSGPNVMLGYAENPLDLNLGDVQLGILHTGDIGHFDNEGLFYVTGRTKRFIKLFGTRINLDAIDSWLLNNGYFGSSLGDDDRLIVVLESDAQLDKDILSEISNFFKINRNFIRVKFVNEIPRKISGKIDFTALKLIVDEM
ncbi:AMP-binding protein [Vibrio vulnificus]|uniref:AMP-binding protein n=1 Tax=Vibrio vulnificus TaxID=672 RepID=UPI001A25291E|nr:AMP-binding protein [Vibrio vulnificus]MCA0772203.1 AMP-binding protein [Vibrio vulnificus]HAS6190393.1 AMP-binding protein [Vibrio vulnificus]